MYLEKSQKYLHKRLKDGKYNRIVVPELQISSKVSTH